MGITWLICGLTLIAYLAAMYLSGRKKVATSRQLRQNCARALLYASGVCCVLAWNSVYFGAEALPMLIVAIGYWAPMVTFMAYHAQLKRETELDHALNYGTDPQHCGRCGYDLTGNVSGGCPECGRRLPIAPYQPGAAEQRSWDEHRRTLYLYDWRLSLEKAFLYSFGFGTYGLIITAFSPDIVGFAILVTTMCVFAAASAVRIALSHRMRESVSKGWTD